MVFLATAIFVSSENAGPPPVITVLDGHNLGTIGRCPICGSLGDAEIEDVDATNLIFGVANRGLDLSCRNSGSLPTTVPASPCRRVCSLQKD